MPRPRKDPLVDEFQTRFKAALQALIGPETGPGLVVAFSGGADSTALLYLLVSLQEELDLELAAAHLDHGLRGRESRQDRRTAQARAQGLGLPFYWEEVDCRALARARRLSLEEAGREARYDFLERVRDQTGARFIATGHTADDNAEVVLLNLLRGAGPQGLAGIPPVRAGRPAASSAERIIRPLLGFWREELLGYLRAVGADWVEDSSNHDLSLTRNRIRRDLLPRLAREYNPGLAQALVRTATILRDEEAAWAGILAELKPRVGWEESGDQVWMQAAPLAGLDRASARRLVRAAVRALTGGTPALGLDHVEAVLGLAAAGSGGLDLPGRLRARVEEDRLVLGPPRAADQVAFEYPLPVPGSVWLIEIRARLSAEMLSQARGLELKRLGPSRAALDLDRLAPPLLVRSPRPGDRFRPLGLGGTKKLSDFFIEARVPAGQRPRVPLVLDRERIVWVGGFRPAEEARVRPETRRVVLLTLEAGE